MRTGARIALALLLVTLAGAIAFVAYQAGIDAGVATADGTEVVRVVGRGWQGGPGFFPGFLFFPLFVVGFFVLARFLFRPWGGPGRGWYGPPGPHRGDWEDRAADWHRRQHDQPSTDARADDPTSSAGPGDDRAGSWPDSPS
ncbi:hypothetical protein [Salsipaludibacter albus]|uniref:hypothetical protein n=1 Tax=Salsipaludibacter albus TaxID=2849650 RepID=UPI001EE4A0EF|nr:hypothetical protein [Salsipaludibacter albus]MBY5163482.1 hypothetical protein [Salsipaludibacter albus]